ncbi:HIRAN domain-containing protein [Rhizobium mayense]|uniref:HIRAN domain-containing protein n=1 Tax=Rhizobium mayense TaxID=1312184 RepID=A0ABT7K2E2_9HYPH|nr:HIRAN domain-containing protein [Rhizobium mayense]MDL2401588.1 HIRAN domain-containing protein [Rhizobium mayense]
MLNQIEHIVEPSRLLLTWQTLDDSKSRTRFAVGELQAASPPTFTYYSEDEFFRVNGKPLTYIRSIGYAQYPAFKPTKLHHVDGVLEAFLRRLPPRNRADFDKYITHFRLSRNTTISDFALLGITEAKLPADGFALVDPLDDTVKTRELMIEVVGHRHYPSDLDGALGEAVDLIPEPENQWDPHAVMVLARGMKVGYINKFQCAAFLQWISEDRVTAVIERVNGTADHPRLYIFVRVSPRLASLAA